MISSPTPNIFEYSDYRTFLRDYYTGRKSNNPSWSLSVWARQLGVKSPSTLAMILNGHRQPGPRLIKRLIHQLRLGREESRYFENLILLKKTGENLQIRFQLLETLGRQRQSGKFTYLDHETFSAIAQWHYYAIRELVSLPGFQEDPEWICKALRFRVSPREVAESIKVMLKLGLLCRNESGLLRSAKGHTETSSDVISPAIRKFHEQAFDNAKLSLHQTSVEEREITGTTFAMPRKNLPRAKEILRKFRDELCDLLESEGSDAVYHIQLALYPVAKVGDK